MFNGLLGDRTYPPRPGDYLIEVYVGLDAPVVIHQSITEAQPVDEIPASARIVGRIDTAGAPAAGWNAMIKSAKNKARRLGGDAIVIGSWGSPLTGFDQYGTAYHGKAISMTVIRYRD